MFISPSNYPQCDWYFPLKWCNNLCKNYFFAPFFFWGLEGTKSASGCRSTLCTQSPPLSSWLRAVNPPSSARIWFLWAWLRASTQMHLLKCFSISIHLLLFGSEVGDSVDTTNGGHRRGKRALFWVWSWQNEPKHSERLTESFLLSMETHSLLDHSTNTEAITLYVKKTKYLNSATVNF